MIIALICVLEGLLIALIGYSIALKCRVSKFDYQVLNMLKNDLEKQVKKLEHENDNLKNKNDGFITKLQNIQNKVAELEFEKKALNHTLDLYKNEFTTIDEKYKLYFENLANRIFDEKTDKFNKISQESLSRILNPLQEHINLFKKQVDDSFSIHNKEQFLLKQEIQRIILANEKITLQAENLADVLKGNVKIQGNWGEMILEKILESSGLRKNQDYVLHGTGMDLQDSEGNKQQPDAIINLPENKHLIIDSKISLIHYEKYFATKSEESKNVLLKQFITSIRVHVNVLSNKKYQNIEKLKTPDFVLMFIPIEGAYSLAMQEDIMLHNYAWNKKIVIVCPSTLFATLRTIESVWRLERQNRNTMEIARQGGALYDKIVGFISDMQKLGKQVNILNNVYNDAMKKLSEGHGNILSRTENLKHLGVKTSKTILENT
ncbi:rmuC family protein [Ehrlichia chaffeensis str. Liberty]|uniref:DNA recombination protein RmuC n=1 Tax=Ehrlichia chaffeensis TaxID=945 RepID=UPI000444E96A|nr:DNA recombination protein RmuC [Ehrlichia chaffeensis]AHX05613.1 rmuC family protein [Ehrlichia chaffeensis str. Jax]AHX06604.1 rmuC family protein [Ehrlichia chaffeensis str. Liberty]